MKCPWPPRRVVGRARPPLTSAQPAAAAKACKVSASRRQQKGAPAIDAAWSKYEAVASPAAAAKTTGRFAKRGCLPYT